ncbi:MAG: hypothetical protein EPO32_11595 [Anaerolineae bacterium]|nr:MAG: hypothetical protein EPO32_11595 [Anaerolineae bacterium]
MKRWFLLSMLLALVLAACGPGFGEVTVLSVDEETGTVEVETVDGDVFTITAPPGFDLSLVAPDMTINLSDGLEEAFEDAFEQAQDGEEEDQDNSGSAFCTDPDSQHPALSGVATDSSIAYSELLALFCEQNYGVGELRQAVRIAGESGMDFAAIIALHQEYGNWGVFHQALKIGEDAGLSLTEVLDLYDELGNWGAVRQELDLTGKPENPGGGNGNGNGNNGNGNGNNDDDDEDDD